MRCKSFKKGCAVGLIALFIIGSLTFPVVAENTGIFNTQGTIYVDDDANCPGHGTLEAPYCTIQLAIDNADDGNDIKIASGEYYENIIVDKKLTLDWHGSDINGSDTGIPVINGGGKNVEGVATAPDMTVAYEARLLYLSETQEQYLIL